MLGIAGSVHARFGVQLPAMPPLPDAVMPPLPAALPPVPGAVMPPVPAATPPLPAVVIGIVTALPPLPPVAAGTPPLPGVVMVAGGFVAPPLPIGVGAGTPPEPAPVPAFAVGGIGPATTAAGAALLVSSAAHAHKTNGYAIENARLRIVTQ